eukprot:XP_019925339.1 PREDICTED: uncharacterized protein LOC105334378 [Crassostrea gigas]
MKILIAIIVVLFETDICHCRKCEGGNNTFCCSGHIWNAELKSCTPCNIGYHGQHCESRCPYPLFGKHCQMVCMCNENDCHHAHGCYNTNQERNGLYTVDILRKIILVNNDKRTKKKTHVNQTTSAATDVGFDKKECEYRRHHGKSVSTIKTTIACLFVLAGILVLLYTGARFMVTK